MLKRENAKLEQCFDKKPIAICAPDLLELRQDMATSNGSSKRIIKYCSFWMQFLYLMISITKDV